MGLTGDFFWILLWSFYFVAYVYVVILIITDLFRDHSLNGWWKALWIIFLVAMPFLTALIYLIARGRGLAERAQMRRMPAPEDDSYRPSASSSPSEDIARAKELLDSGAITQGEFDALKSKALGNQYFGA